MKAAIYARVSSEKQERQKTIERQLADCRDCAKSIGTLIHDEYCDDGYSGTLLNRPSLDRLMEDAKRGLFDVVIIDSPDRLARKSWHQGFIRDELISLGVRVIFRNMPDAKDTPEDDLSLNMQGAIAEYMKAKIVQRMRRGKLFKATQGILVTSQAPYGYIYVPADKTRNLPRHFEIVEVEAEVIRLMFHLLVDKRMSVRGIVRELAARGIKTRRGKDWSRSSVARILRDETYAGTTYYNKNVRVEPRSRRNNNGYSRASNTSLRRRPKNEWKAIGLPKELIIIDRQTFDRAQMQLEANSRLSPRNTKYKYLLRGLVRCGRCDSQFYGMPCHGKLYYRCGRRDSTLSGDEKCSAGSVKAENLESVVWAKLAEAILNPALIVTQYSKLQGRATSGEAKLLKGIKAVDKNLASIDCEQNRLLDAYTEGAVSLEQLKAKNGEIEKRKDCLEARRLELLAQLESHKAGHCDPESVEQVCRKIAKRLESIQRDFEAKLYLLALLVTRIIIEGRRVRIRGILPASLPPSEPSVSHTASQSS